MTTLATISPNSLELDDGRKWRGYQIAEKGGIQSNRLGWKVPSQSSSGSYVVSVEGSPFCTCPDFELRQSPCKHVWAVVLTVRKTIQTPTGMVTIVETKKVTYGQEWASYNKAQVNEKDHFQVLLHDLCKGLKRPRRKGAGRPRIPLDDAIFSAVFKVYSTVSGRRFASDLRTAEERGYVRKAPSYNSIFKVFSRPETAAVLETLIKKTAKPLKSLEENFAADSSGFSSSRHDRWYDQKYGEKKSKRQWVKAHIMVGTKTNVVTALEIGHQHSNDSPMLPKLIDSTDENFDMKQISADMAYSAEKNLQAIEDVGAVPFIPFKSNATPARGGIWARAYHYFNLYREQFDEHYHRRSNVETTFAMIKAKFGEAVRSKTATAMKNEVRAKILCHNICCLIQAMYELGIDPKGWER